jgi:hypothetical protein
MEEGVLEDKLKGKILYPDDLGTVGKSHRPASIYLGIVLICVGLLSNFLLFIGGHELGLTENMFLFLSILFGLTFPLMGIGCIIFGITTKPIKLYENGLDNTSSEFIPWEEVERVEIFGERVKASYRTIKFNYSGIYYCKDRIDDLSDAHKIADIFSKKIPDKFFWDSQPGFVPKVTMNDLVRRKM